MNESSDTPDNPDKPQDYPGLRAELAELVNDFLPVADELWPRLQDHKYRWELYGYRLPDGYDKLVASDIIALLVEALKSVSVARNKLTHAHLKADDHNPGHAVERGDPGRVGTTRTPSGKPRDRRPHVPSHD
jgi:hypothetical protein